MPAKIVAIVGPTASGKSALAMQLARQHGGEIICADSRTVYKGLDIGTAKPSRTDQAEIRHHLLDVVEPGQTFNAAQFKQAAESAIVDITSRGKLPILVGGTGLYMDAVLFDYSFGAAADAGRREALNKLSVEELRSLCRANSVLLPKNSTNRRHLVRAIELGGLLKQERRLRPATIVVGIATDRTTLRTRIAARAQAMVQAGILDEVRELYSRYGWESEAMTGNIYRIFRRVIEGQSGVDEALAQFVQSDMRLAKRQMTWFKRNPAILWSAQPAELSRAIGQFLKTE